MTSDDIAKAFLPVRTLGTDEFSGDDVRLPRTEIIDWAERTVRTAVWRPEVAKLAVWAFSDGTVHVEIEKSDKRRFDLEFDNSGGGYTSIGHPPKGATA